MNNKLIIGSIESIDLVELGLFNLDAKVDTGAENSAIHGDIIEINNNQVTFELHDDIHPSYNGKIITLPIYRIGDVKSSNGESQERVFIKTTVSIFGVEYETEISLSDRSKMKYPMLLGKQFLLGRFIVDVEQDYLSLERKNKC